MMLYFSGTGNTEYIARRFSAKMGCKCLSIEDDADFDAEIHSHDIIAFAYPIYSSRAPRIMREFAAKYAHRLRGKKIIILVTQMLFSGDGARSFTDIFKRGYINVIYAEHFNMPNNVSNFMLLKLPRSMAKQCIRRAEMKLERVCRELRSGIVRRRGFNGASRFLGKFQGVPWLAFMEQWARGDIRVGLGCTLCGLCTNICPMDNLRIHSGKVIQRENCTICYRCVNRCPTRAITVMIHKKPPWQYRPIFRRDDNSTRRRYVKRI
ncbi:MAG: EFR1 family ferrodoxin [Defluviitaleaceae bacterium]|nr:EFR1 family ferrodoxin [Defluviitaleaceae bacterium]